MVMRSTRLIVWLSVAATLVTAAGLALGLRFIHLSPLAVLAAPDDFAARAPLAVLGAIGAVAIAQAAALRVRVGDGSVKLAWGEAAIVVAWVWLPGGLVPAAILVGATIGHAALTVMSRNSPHRRTAGDLLYGIAVLTFAAGLGTAVVTAIAPTYEVRLDPHSIFALTVASFAYANTAAFLVALRVVAKHGGQFGATFRDMVSSKLPMLIGNIVIGLLIVWSRYTDVWFLLLLPPLVWLLYQFYGHRLRGDDEKRTWQEFADATQGLNRLDERDAAAAGLAGALRLFRATRAELVIDVPPGEARAYTSDDAPVDRTAAGHLITRPLLVRHARIGELRLAGVRSLRSRESMMLAAYGDALAAAIHDAITHDELRSMSERTTYDAIHDPLTGLVNRAALLARGNSALQKLDAGAEVALLLLDIDDFKEVNNALGHTAGDELLQVIARRMSDAAQPGDLLARLGGDEFALLMTAPAAAGGGAVERARRLGAQLAVPTEVAGVFLSVEASIGVGVARAGDVDMTELLRRADIAMYQAKRGGQAVAAYEAVHDEASVDRLALLAELREALATGDQLTLALQPAVALANSGPVSVAGAPVNSTGFVGGEITGVEALVRWQHPRRGRLTPEQFVPTVEQSELIGPMTLRVLDLALETAARWRSAGLAVPISVNLSPRSLLDRNLPTQVERLLVRHRVPPRLLVLEITESVVMSDLPVTDDVLAGLRALGVQLAVDDFGTGYSSLTFLTRVQVEEVKIDRAFVQHMVDSPEASAIVRTTIELARSLGLRVVAEGVETAEQRSLLTKQGCTAAQGYHFYAPLAADKVLAVLRERRHLSRRHLRADGAG
jgi:diguanylate cyclase